MNNFFNSRIEDKVIIFTIIKSSPNYEEWKIAKKTVLEWYTYLENNNLKAGLIFNLEELNYINPSYLIEWKQLFLDNAQRTKQNIIASAIIIDNTIIRQVVNLFFKMYDSVRPTKIVKNIVEAKSFILENII